MKLLKFYATLTFALSITFCHGQLKTIPSGTTSKKATLSSPLQVNAQTTREKRSLNLDATTILSAATVKNGLRIQKWIPESQTLWIDGKIRQAAAVRNADLNTRVEHYLSGVKELLQIPESFDFNILSSEMDYLGMEHTRVAQTYKGIPIHGADAIIHSEGDVIGMNGKTTLKSLSISTEPAITLEEAERSTIDDLPIYQEEWSAYYKALNVEKKNSTLTIYPTADGYKLAYHISIHNTMIDRWEYFLDAQSGEVIEKYQNICKLHAHVENNDHTHIEAVTHAESHASSSEAEFAGPATSTGQDLFGVTRSLNTYEDNGDYFMIDVTRPMFDPTNSNLPDDPVGAIWTIDARNTSPENDDFEIGHVFSTDNNWSGEETGLSAHYNAGLAYEYFKNTFGRESVNAQGGNIVSLVNVADSDGSSLDNAFWNGVAMFYGNGKTSFLPLARALDVAIHEIGHGVVQTTANLEYKSESGALNESLADIFGAMGDREDWLIGEDVVRTSAFPSGALRNLQDPNNGAARGDYGRGYQPKTYSDRFTGEQDNGGVHINSGIPNHAFYLTATEIGKAKAEQIFYRALTTYLTKSSRFIDLRLSTIQAAMDLYGNGSEVTALRSAFDQVEIFDGDGTDNQEDVEVNPGSVFMIASDATRSNLYLYNGALENLVNGDGVFSNTDHISRPSITDDGTAAVFIGADKKMYIINIDWDAGSFEQRPLQEDPVWRNVIISKDGQRLAALFDELDNTIWVYDFNTENAQTFELFNPTFTEGVTTGDVLYADAMEFDFNGQYIMYDAFNNIPSQTGTDIDYWDIGFIKVWDNGRDNFGLGGIEKLFSTLPEGVSVGNPTFSRNSDYVIAFDLLEENVFYAIGANLETGDLNELFSNNEGPHYPNFTMDDNNLFHDLPFLGSYDLGRLGLDNTKINVENGSETIVLAERRWGVWFANGERDITSSLSDLVDIEVFTAYPNPSTDILTLEFEMTESRLGKVEVYAMGGQRVISRIVDIQAGKNKIQTEVADLPTGAYIAMITTENSKGSVLFYKQ